MGRFMYVHFGDDVPRNIEKEYNKLLRKERYILICSASLDQCHPNGCHDLALMISFGYPHCFFQTCHVCLKQGIVDL